MAAVLLIFASVLGGFLGAYVGVLVAWWKIKDEVMGRLARQAVEKGLSWL